MIGGSRQSALALVERLFTTTHAKEEAAPVDAALEQLDNHKQR